MMLLYSRDYLVLTLLSMIGLALPSDHEASVMTQRKISKGSKKNPTMLFREQIPIKMEAPKMMSEQEMTATVAEVVNDILNDDQRRGLLYFPDWFSVKTTGMTETECTDPEAECEKNSDSTGYRWCGSTQTCVPPGDPFPPSCFTDAPLTPEEACEKNSDSTGYRWCGSTQTCVPPGDPFPFSCSLTPEEACDKNSGSTGYRWCGRTQTCVPPGGDFPPSCFTDAPLTPEEACEKNSGSTGYRWCGSTQTCVPPGGPLPLSCFTDAPLTPEEACDMNSGSTGYRWCASTQTCVPPGGDFPPSCFTGIACYKASIAIESKVDLLPNAIAKLKNVLVKGIARNGVRVRGTKQARAPSYSSCPQCESCTCNENGFMGKYCVEANNITCSIQVTGDFGKECAQPSRLLQCLPATVPCSTTARTFTGPNSLCTGIYDGNKGRFTCDEIVAHDTNYGVGMYYNCMDDPSSSDGRCVAQNICYPTW